MKSTLLLLLFACSSLLAQNNFSGTWVTKLDSAEFSKKPEVWSLQNGTYTCSTCVPKFSVKADGQDQKRTGSHYVDTMSVKVVDANTINIESKKDGKSVGTSTETVSDGGKTLTEKFTYIPEGSSQPVEGEMIYTRSGAATPGAHAISGSWVVSKVPNLSQNGLTVTYEATADGLKMTAPTGQSYDAKFDGKPVPIENDPGHTTASLKKIDDKTIEETDTRDGKVVDVSRMTLSPDGKSINVTDNDKERGTTMTFTMQKQ